MLEILHEERQHNTPEQIERVIALVEYYGCCEYAEEVCMRKARESMDYLQQIPHGEGRDTLAEMLDFLVQRAF